ncbi:acetyl-CoA carboxylase carbosyltransferase beta subunit [Cucumis melo var. makuwa]|uniref:Acetyl-CoA carboxylase carbosyltransferase beta subunit n=1 Tax=Cucumis melo var. makuwa TaxID=1194695 RepID=A0A5A7TTI9_CUCMM|nr:acetyl-CoA carboxylase carbosyltransferase beta subunit [Cucumis melo var. makuwa]TYK00207.1 acetyl-CoA carboxylase carbosyltransferase beta subunit [Cucumis melo var. makuwa]
MITQLSSLPSIAVAHWCWLGTFDLEGSSLRTTSDFELSCHPLVFKWPFQLGDTVTRLSLRCSLLAVCYGNGRRVMRHGIDGEIVVALRLLHTAAFYVLSRVDIHVECLCGHASTWFGVTTSFGMLGDIIIAEPNAYIAFVGKRVIEQTLNKAVPEGSQEAESLFDKGLFDLIVPRNPLKGVVLNAISALPSGSSIMKSIDTCFHFHSGALKGCNISMAFTLVLSSTDTPNAY